MYVKHIRFSPKKREQFSQRGPFSHSATPSFLVPFFPSEDTPFGDLLNDALIRQTLEDHQCRFGETYHAVYTPLLTMWMFLWQLLSDESCDAAVATAIAYCNELGLKPPGTDTGGYVRARNKIPSGVFADLTRHLARALDTKAPNHWKPFGRTTWIVDGTTFTLPATEDNLAKFQCHPNQHSDVGMPLPRAIVLLSMTTGCVLDFTYDNYSGKGTGEISMLRSRLDVFQPGDLVVMDALYCSFTTMALLKQRGVDVVVRMSGSRLVDHRSSERLDQGDYLMTWKRPNKSQIPAGYCEDDFPETMKARVVRYRVKNSENKWETFQIVTTLLDEKKYSREEVAALYNQRWNGETDIRTLKGALSLDQVRCQTPDNVEREVWGTLLGYNLVRRSAATAAYVVKRLFGQSTDMKPRDIGYQGTWNIVAASWMMRSLNGPALPEILQRIMLHIAKHRAGHRPGRLEPRVVRKRPKPQPKMKKARSAYHRRLAVTIIEPEYF